MRGPSSPPGEEAFPTRAVTLGAVLTLALVGAAAGTTWHLFCELSALVATELRIRSLAGSIIHIDEVLTMSARMAAATGDRRWEARYREFEPKLDAALQEAVALAPEAYVSSSAVSATAAANAKLIAMEAEAFKLVRRGALAQAAAVLSSIEYDIEKDVYSGGIFETNAALERRALDAVGRARERIVVIGLASLAVLLGLIVIWSRIIGLIRRYLATGERSRRELFDNNASLESRVIARTAELLQAQKLEAIGRLAAGIAHEINTPIQFVSDNVHFLSASAQQLTDVVDCYQQALKAIEGGGTVASVRASIQAVEERNELGFVRENMPMALAAAVEGLDRVGSILQSMKQLSFQDRGESGLADLNQSVLSTLTVARGEYRCFADVVTELGALPPVRCRISDINQVVLNLVVNAAHAIEEKVGDRGTITVRTWVDGEDACIAVRDTGVGIDPTVRDRIFDPFFTTKAVGRGTGQGLAIAHHIVVERHGGEIAIDSQLGRGTELIIRLPIEGITERIVVTREAA